jgi:hypothetical protein
MVELTRPDGAIYRIDTTEVTVSQYLAFAQSADPSTAAQAPQCTANTSFSLDISPNPACFPRHPALPADWCDAWAYCAFAGKSLCKPDVWYLACSNGGTTWYPYGHLYDGKSCQPGLDCGFDWSSETYNVDCATNCHGMSPPYDQVFGMTGNAREWVDDCSWCDKCDLEKAFVGWICGVRGAPSGSDLIDASSETGCMPSDRISPWSVKTSAQSMLDTYARVGFRCCQGPVCDPGASQPCYEGPPATLGMGLCAAGTQSCLPDGSGWGPCTGQILPQTETCASPGDDDCNGLVNESGADCSCTPGEETACYSAQPSTLGVGVCVGGKQVCNVQGNGFGPCAGEIAPATESCSAGNDEDCDGQANESGAGCTCVPGETRSCYEGDAVTRGIGACHDGIQTCLASGTAWGPCNGQQLPQLESCLTPADDDCDGHVNERGVGQPCPSGHVWSKSFGSKVADGATDIAFDPPGHLLVLGRLYNTDLAGVAPIDLGGGPLPCLGMGDNAFVARYTVDGAYVWARRLRGEEAFWPVSLALDAAHGIYFTGGFTGTIDLGGGPWTGSSTAQGYVVRLDPDGHHVWSRKLAGSGHVRPTQVTLDASSRALVAGTFLGTLTTDAGTLNGIAPKDPYARPPDGFVAAYDSDGTALWLTPWRATQGIDEVFVAPEPSGSILVAASCSGVVTAGALTYTTVAGSWDVCLLRLSPDGQPTELRVYGDHGDQTVDAMVVGPDGRVHLGGRVLGELSFGTMKLWAQPPFHNAYVAVLEPAGDPVWVHAFPNAGSSPSIHDIAVGADGTGLVSGGFGFLAWYAPSAGLLGSSLVYPGPSDVAVGPGGSALVASDVGINPLTDFGGGPLYNKGAWDIALARLQKP